MIVAMPSLNDRIRQDIEALIMSGIWEAGSRIPPEHELMVDYGCSRVTVSKAISGLVERGLIERRKRAGSFVAAPRVHRAVLEIADIAAEVEGAGRAHSLDLLDRVERDATPEDARLLAMAKGRVLALTCLHRAGGAPFALEERLVNLSQVPDSRKVDFTRIGPGRWLLDHVPWTDARHRITAIAADAAIAAHIGVEPRAACLLVERWTWRTAERITYVRQIYPGDHALTARFAA